MSVQREYAVKNPYNGAVMEVPGNSLANAQKMAALVGGSLVMTRTVTDWVADGSTTSDHYVRHVLRPGDYVKTEFECRAPFGSRCRLACDQPSCREQCICESEHNRNPDLQDQGECLITAWLKNDAPEECYTGEEMPVRGPDWQPIVPEWNGDTWDWDYAE